MSRYQLFTALGAGLVLGVSISMAAMAAQPGWTEESGVKRFVDNNGSYVKNEWRTDDGTSYYLDSRGNVAVDTWIEDTYYVDSQGAMQKNTWVEEDGSTGLKEPGWYYVGRDGKAEKNDWKIIDDFRYTFDNDGRMRTGWHYEGGEIYYLGDEEQGFAQSGWQVLEDNEKMPPKEGDISRDLKAGSSQGRWFYFQKNGKAKRAKSKDYEPITIEGKKYYFDENGVMLTGWHAVRATAEPGDALGITRFLYLGDKDEGIVKSQWLELKQHPWDSEDGAVLKVSKADYEGPKKGESCRYYFKNDGTLAFLKSGASSMNDAAVRIDGDSYFFDQYGCMHTGLVKLRKGSTSQNGYFGAAGSKGIMHYGRVTEITDKSGKELICYFNTSGSDKGAGLTGEKDGFLYYGGLLVTAKEGTDYQPFLVNGTIYLVNESGRIQTGEKKYQSAGKDAYLIEDGAVYTVDEDGEKKEEVKSGKALPTAAFDYVYTA